VRNVISTAQVKMFFHGGGGGGGYDFAAVSGVVPKPIDMY
jgi:hypothetical protein